MPLLLLDLDNTLIDRDLAFRRAVETFLRENDLPSADVEWVMTEDADGYAPRERVAAAMRSRWGEAVSAKRIDALLAGGAMDHVRPDPTIDAALRIATEQGWTPVVVTNGGSTQQRGKLRASGLDRLVAGCVISEEAGYRKPDPEIFHAAAHTVGASLDGAWMIGDSAVHDIAGAAAVGIDSIWLSRGRSWPTAAVPTAAGQHTPRPTSIADRLPEAVALLPPPRSGEAVASPRWLSSGVRPSPDRTGTRGSRSRPCS